MYTNQHSITKTFTCVLHNNKNIRFEREREMEMVEDVVIVGAGIAGLATALALKRVGVESFLVLEKAEDLRTTGSALTLFPNAWVAIDSLGISHKLTSIYAPLPK